MKANNPSFHEVTNKLLTDIEGLLGSVSEDGVKPIKDKPDAEALSRLLAACDAYNMDDVDAAMKDIESCKYSADDGLVAWLRENVDQMNFAEIKERLSGTAKT